MESGDDKRLGRVREDGRKPAVWPLTVGFRPALDDGAGASFTESGLSMDRQPRHVPGIEAIVFDLLTALVDSWSLWIEIAGDERLGRCWRTASLRRVTSTGKYRAYEEIVHEVTEDVGLPSARADELLGRWRDLKPWPEAPGVLDALADRRLAILTNCSQALAEQATAATGGTFEPVMSAERAGIYKPAARAYRAALSALDLPADKVLFVAGSAHDVSGAAGVGMTVYWSNRQGLDIPADARPRVINASDLEALPDVVTSASV